MTGADFGWEVSEAETPGELRELRLWLFWRWAFGRLAPDRGWSVPTLIHALACLTIKQETA